MTLQHNTSALSTISCPPALRREALLHLDATHDPLMQQALSSALKAMKNGSDENWQGLWIIQHAGRIKSAIWVQPLPMHMAQLWLPRTQGLLLNQGLSDEQRILTRLLLRAAYAWVTTRRIRLCHVMLTTHTAAVEELLLESDMQCLNSLESLIGSSSRRLAMHKAMPLMLQPLGYFSQAEQLALLTAVGHDSLDSCALRDIISVEDLLSGFYLQDPQAPQHWYAVGYHGTVVGVLLLAARPALNRWELMLMGLTPKWRGRGLGRSLLNKALELAHQAGAQDIVLTVDNANLPAKRLYKQAGFMCYTKQRLFAWQSNAQ